MLEPWVPKAIGEVPQTLWGDLPNPLGDLPKQLGIVPQTAWGTTYRTILR